MKVLQKKLYIDTSVKTHLSNSSFRIFVTFMPKFEQQKEERGQS